MKKKLKDVSDSRTYHLILLNYRYPPYWDEGIRFKKGIYPDKYRSYKTWKHSRKTKYKI